MNAELLTQTDGPMLLHGLQETNGVKLWTPRATAQRPDPARLEIRYEEFRRAG